HSLVIFFFSSRRRHTRFSRDWSSDVCSSDLALARHVGIHHPLLLGAELSAQHCRLALAQRRLVDVELVRVHRTLDHHLAEAVAQIGRASCRERVKMPELDVALKTLQVQDTPT